MTLVDELRLSVTNTSDIERIETLRPLLPTLRGLSSMVSIGEQLREGWGWWVQLFRALGFTSLSVLEVWKPYIEQLIQVSEELDFDHLYHCDVLRVAEKVACPTDVVLWWHGPEHLATPHVRHALAALRSAFQPKVIILGMTWGRHGNQDREFANPHAYHVSQWMPRELEAMGFTTRTTGSQGRTRGHITAWRVA